MGIKDKFISNTTYLFLDIFFINFFMMSFWIIVGKTLSPEAYGIIATSLQIAVFLSAITAIGFSSTLRKLVPELFARNKKDKLQGLINYSFKIILVSSLIITLVLFLLSSLFAPFLKLQSEVLQIVALLIFIIAIGNFFADILFGFQNMKKIFLTNFLGNLICILLTLFFIVLGFNYFGPLIASLLCYSVILLTRFSKKFFEISKKITIDKNLIFKFLVPSFISTLFLLLFSNTQFIILSFFKTTELTGRFAVAFKICSIISVIPSILISALFPITSELSVDRKGKIKQPYLIKLVFRYNLFITLPIAFFLIIFSKYVILFFSKSAYLPAMEFLPLLTIAGLFLGLGQLFTSSLYAIGQPNKHRNVWIITSLSYILSSIPLTYYFSGTGLHGSSVPCCCSMWQDLFLRATLAMG